MSRLSACCMGGVGVILWLGLGVLVVIMCWVVLGIAFAGLCECLLGIGSHQLGLRRQYSPPWRGGRTAHETISPKATDEGLLTQPRIRIETQRQARSGIIAKSAMLQSKLRVHTSSDSLLSARVGGRAQQIVTIDRQGLVSLKP